MARSTTSTDTSANDTNEARRIARNAAARERRAALKAQKETDAREALSREQLLRDQLRSATLRADRAEFRAANLRDRIDNDQYEADRKRTLARIRSRRASDARKLEASRNSGYDPSLGSTVQAFMAGNRSNARFMAGIKAMESRK